MIAPIVVHTWSEIPTLLEAISRVFGENFVATARKHEYWVIAYKTTTKGPDNGTRAAKYINALHIVNIGIQNLKVTLKKVVEKSPDTRQRASIWYAIASIVSSEFDLLIEKGKSAAIIPQLLISVHPTEII